MTAPSSIPPDPALPQLPSLLDPELMSGVLGRSLAPDLPAPVVRIGYLRYRPARSLLVGYEADVGDTPLEAFVLADAKADLAARAASSESAALVAKLEGRAPARTPLAYEQVLDALVHWLPLDPGLPAMAEAPEQLRDRFVAAGLRLEIDDVPRVVKHKPMTRGVLRLNHHIVKAYRDAESFGAAVRALERSASLPFPTARCTAVVPELLLAAQSLVPGQRPKSPAEVASQAGTLLAALHAIPIDDLPLELPRDRLTKAAKHTRLLAAIVPGLASRLDGLLTRLDADLPRDEPVPSHGGFHLSQLLQSDGELGVIDFDGMCLAPAALDVTGYVASLVERPEDLPQAAETLDVLVDAYGNRPPGATWYLATQLLGRARRPFTRFKPGWPDEVEERFAAAEAALEL
jgi:Phosphotransferase enzyme family